MNIRYPIYEGVYRILTLDTGWPHPATQSSRRNNQPVICCLLCIAYSFIARNVEAGMPASFIRFALVKGCQP